MEFKKAIQDKYRQEVNPTFSEEHWESFLAYETRRKRKPRGMLILLITIVTTALVLGSFWFLKTTQVHQSHYTKVTPPPEDPKQGQTSSAQRTTSPSTSEKLHADISQPAAATGDAALSQANAKSKNENNTVGSFLAKANAGEFLNNTKKSIHKNQAEQGLKNLVMADNAEESLKYSVTEDSPTPVQYLLMRRNIHVRPQTATELSANAAKIDVMQDANWVPKQWSFQIYGGLAVAFQIGTLDEQMHQFGSLMSYNLSKRLRAKFGFEFTAVDFAATEMNPAIGIDFVESPSDLVVFSEAVVESGGLNLDLGFDYLLWQGQHLNIYAGASYRLSTEILKGIEYEFVGDDDSGKDDDIFISSSKSSRYFEPLNLNLTLGLSYYVKNNGFNLSIGRPIQLSRSKVDLLDQLQINFGIIRKL